MFDRIFLTQLNAATHFGVEDHFACFPRVGEAPTHTHQAKDPVYREKVPVN
jgi:hypothetical protein